jgi:hypothetical protein
MPPSILFKLPGNRVYGWVMNTIVSASMPDYIRHFSGFAYESKLDCDYYQLTIVEDYPLKGKLPGFDPRWARVRIFKNHFLMHFSFVQLV